MARTVAFGTLAPGFFLALAAIVQPHLGAVLHRSWPLAVAGFGAGALSITMLKPPLNLIASWIVVVAMGAVAAETGTGVRPIGMMSTALGEIFFGIAVYSVVFQLRPGSRT